MVEQPLPGSLAAGCVLLFSGKLPSGNLPGAADQMARSRPAWTVDAIISPISASMIGVRPLLTGLILVYTGSTPMTLCPSLAKHPAETVPT